MLKSFIFGLATLAIPLSVLADNAQLNQETQIQYGQLIYLEGKLPNNNPLTGVRNGMEWNYKGVRPRVLTAIVRAG